MANLSPFWLLLRSVRAQLFRAPPAPSWSFSQRVLVEACRQLSNAAREESAERQRAICAPPRPALPKGVTRVELELAGRRAYQFTSDTATKAGLVLHFHGGGYVMGSIEEQNRFLGALAKACAVPIVTLDYRLAPEHLHPAALEDALGAVRALMDGGVDASRIVLAGDSAGAGLALATLVRLESERLPRLAGAVLGSAWVDLTCPGASATANADVDCFDVELARVWAAMVAGPGSLREPLLSPSYADLEGLPPLQFVVGELEVLRDDILSCEKRARAAHVRTEVIVGAAAVHCWYASGGQLPGPPDTLERMADFISRVVGADR